MHANFIHETHTMSRLNLSVARLERIIVIIIITIVRQAYPIHHPVAHCLTVLIISYVDSYSCVYLFSFVFF